MLKLTKTGIGLLTRQYRSVLKKCWAINVGIFALSSIAAMIPSDAEAEIVYDKNDSDGVVMNLFTESTLHIGYPGINIINTDQEDSAQHIVASLTNVWQGGGELTLHDKATGSVETYLRWNSFKLNNSSVVADGITSSVINGSNNLITSGGVYTALNNYYTKGEVDSDYWYLHMYFAVNSTGRAASATGTASIALGVSSTASGNYSTALGNFSVANEVGVVSVGRTPVPESVISQLWSQTKMTGVYNLLRDYGYTSTDSMYLFDDISVGVSHDEIIKKYKLDGYSKIVNVADGVNAHDAATVGQMNSALNNYYTKV